MKTCTFIKKTILCIALGFMTLALSAQTTVNNNANSAADFTSLQAAIDAANPGDIIYLQHSATSYGVINITQSVTIIGRSSGDSNYISEVGRINLTDGGSNTTIKGLKIADLRETGSGFIITNVAFIDCNITSGIFNLGTVNTFNNMLFQGNVINGVITLRENTSNVLMTNNIILSTTLNFYMVDTLIFGNNIFGYYTGVTINNKTSSLLNIQNSIFVCSFLNARTVGLTSDPGGTILVDNCISYNYGTGTLDFTPAAGLTVNANTQQNIDPMFTSVDPNNPNSIAHQSAGVSYDPVNDDLNLLVGSTVVDDGIYAGYNFKRFGKSSGYPSIKVLSSSTSVPKNGNLSVTIEAKTN